MLGIAVQFGVPLDELMAINQEVDPHILIVGTALFIPIGEGSTLGHLDPRLVSNEVGNPVCYPVADGGLWCIALVINDHQISVDNVSTRIQFIATNGREIATATAYTPINLMPGGEAMQLMVYFPPPVPEQFIPQLRLCTTLLVPSSDSRYMRLILFIEM